VPDSPQEITPGSSLTYRAHGVSFDYPAGWQDETGDMTGTSGAASTLWTIGVGPGTLHDGSRFRPPG
jgi:hypothetical protein